MSSLTIAPWCLRVTMDTRPTLPEREIRLAESGEVASVNFRERLEAHRLIEEFMIRANVAAAEVLGTRRTPLIYRVHEEPPPEKLETLQEIVDGAGLALAKGQVISTKLVAGKPVIHILADQDPGDGFHAAETTLEDVFFSRIFR